MMDIQAEEQQIKKELVDLIIAHLKENKIDVETAQKLAQEFLAVLPFSDQKDLLSKLQNLGQTYEEAKEVYIDELTKASNQKQQNVLSQMRDALSQGNIDHAVKVAKTL